MVGRIQQASARRQGTAKLRHAGVELFRIARAKPCASLQCPHSPSSSIGLARTNAGASPACRDQGRMLKTFSSSRYLRMPLPHKELDRSGLLLNTTDDSGHGLIIGPGEKAGISRSVRPSAGLFVDGNGTHPHPSTLPHHGSTIRLICLGRTGGRHPLDRSACNRYSSHPWTQRLQMVHDGLAVWCIRPDSSCRHCQERRCPG